MSRVGKQPIIIPDGVSVTQAGALLSVKGPKGELQQKLHDHVCVNHNSNQMSIAVLDPENANDRALWGLFQRLVANMVEGVTKGFEKKLEINGVGFKAAVSGSKITLNLGFSHPVDYALPSGIAVQVEKNIITVSGIDKHLVGEVAAQIRAMKKPEPYKGKGIKYVGEVIRRKAGKAAKAGAK